MRKIFLEQQQKFIQWVKQISVHNESPDSLSWQEILEIIQKELLYESWGRATER